LHLLEGSVRTYGDTLQRERLAVSQVPHGEIRWQTSAKARFGNLEEARDKISRVAVIGAFVGLVVAMWALFLH
jgi:hypothetical protein